MHDGPRASIIINNYNYGRFLEEAIESALGQSYQNVEVIVVDDGSTDESHHVIESYGRRIIPVFKENGGQGSAYNAGFSISQGDAICFLDSDDTLFPHALERATTLIHSGRAAKAQWPLAITDSAGRPTGEMSTKRPPPQGDLRTMVMRDGPFYDWYLTTGALYPRWLLKQVFPVPEQQYRIGSDEYLVTLAPAFGDVLNHSEALGTYRNHGGNSYFGRAPTEARIREYMARFEINCAMLAEHLEKLGIHGDVEDWKQRNFNYLWPQRLLRARQDIRRLVPDGARYVLINNDEWGAAGDIPGRHAVPFLDNDGAYWGPPEDGQTAVRELERLRAEGARVAVFWWTAFWWLERYSLLSDHLRSHYHCLMNADHIIAFDLRTRVHGETHEGVLQHRR